MLERIFNAIVISSIFASIFFCLLTLIKPLTKKYFSAFWHYFMYFCIVLVLVIPIKINIPMPKEETKSISVSKYIPYEKIQSGVSSFENVKSAPNIKIDYSKIWILTSVSIFIIKMAKYGVFALKLKRRSKKLNCDDLPNYINVRNSEIITSPFVLGVFFPKMYLPKTDMTDEELRYVLRHEMTHIKRCDVLIKWVVMFAKCLHWFNPIVYFLSKEISLWCEISCDVSVTKNMDNQNKKNYAFTILKLIEHSHKKQILTTSMASSKKIIGKRFRFIKMYKKRKTTIISSFLSFIMLISFFTLNGIAIGIVNKEKQKPLPRANSNTVLAEKSVEEIQNDDLNEKVIEEIITEDIKDEVLENEKVDAIYEEENNEKSEEEILIEEAYFAGDVIIEEFTNEMNTGKIIQNENSNSVLFKSPLDVVNLKSSHTWFNYSFDKNFSYSVTVIPDENGRISLFFDTDFDGVSADIYISHIDRPNKGWGYSFPMSNKKIYRFVGFEKNEKYQITISGYYPGGYGINGKALII
ncbi:MAG: M56 family metallopeptidase [Ruminococcaceae bacterium]|nr:M56 family metallopeptidase [Oscillospiraceae bacterium]